jgi:hypothetical protein
MPMVISPSSINCAMLGSDGAAMALSAFCFTRWVRIDNRSLGCLEHKLPRNVVLSFEIGCQQPFVSKV